MIQLVLSHSYSCNSDRHLFAKLDSVCYLYPTLGEQMFVGPSLSRKVIQ